MSPSRITLFALALGILALLSGCSGDGGGRANDVLQSDVRLAGADVLIDGTSVDSATVAPGSGSSTLFTATLADPGDTSRIRNVQMEYPVHSSTGMMGHGSTVSMYDDGSHGDPVPGDGVYCYLDADGHIGPHDDDCPRGDYVYRFHGTDMLGHETNWIECRVTVR